MDNCQSGKCKLCDTELKRNYNSHIFNVMNVLEELKYINMVVDHYLKNHKEEYKFTLLDRIGVFSRKLIRAILRDILMIVITPISLIISVLHKVFEWLNDRMGLF